MEKFSLNEIEKRGVEECHNQFREVCIEERIEMLNISSFMASLFAPCSLSASEEREFTPLIALYFLEFAFGKEHEICKKVKELQRTISL